MESIAEQIRIRLQGGETPQELIKKGFKKTTVYSVGRKVKAKPKKDSDELSLEELSRDIEELGLEYVFLASIVKEAMGWLMDDMNFDSAEEPRRWASVIELAGKHFEQVMGRKPPKDFLTASLTLPE